MIMATKKAASKKAVLKKAAGKKTVAKKAAGKRLTKPGILSRTAKVATEVVVNFAKGAVSGGIEKVEEIVGIQSDTNQSKSSNSSNKGSRARKA